MTSLIILVLYFIIFHWVISTKPIISLSDNFINFWHNLLNSDAFKNVIDWVLETVINSNRFYSL